MPLYAPPPLVNPTTIELGAGFTQTTLDPTKDYVLKLPPVKKVGSTYILGGHNVVIIGGQITVPPALKADGSVDTSNAAPSRAIYVKGATGTVHIEGVLIDASGGAMMDGIDIAAPQATVQIENVRVTGIYGFFNQFHADVIQTEGGVKVLHVDGLTGDTGYQGVNVQVDQGPVGPVDLHHVDLKANGAAVWGAANNGGYLLWPCKVAGCPSPRISLDQVYLQPRPGQQAVWTQDKPQALNSSFVRPMISFPGLWIDGHVTIGAPPAGPFVTTAGLAYVSPGYAP